MYYEGPFGAHHLEADINELKREKLDRWEVQRMIDQAINDLRNELRGEIEAQVREQLRYRTYSYHESEV